MRNVEGIARYVLDKFLDTKDFRAMELTLDTQRVYIGFKQHKLLKNQKLLIRGSSAENSCKNNAPRH